MPGKATRPDDKRRLGLNGGAKPGAGRPKLNSPEDSKARGIHQIRAYDDEWELIKEFQKLTRKDVDICREWLEKLKEKIAKA